MVALFGAALSGALCFTGVASAADDAAKAYVEKPGPTGLTLKDFTAPDQISLPKLSPSGKQLVVVRRFGDEDQVVLIDIADPTKGKLIFHTAHVSPELAKKNWRQYISYLEWKSDDTLLVSVSLPVKLNLGDEIKIYDEPVHVIVSADGKFPALPLNEHVQGRMGVVDLSEILDPLRNDADHILLMVWPQLQSIQVDRVDIHSGKHEVLERGDEEVVTYGTDKKGNIVTRVVDRGGGWRTIQGRSPGETHWSKIIDIRRKELKELSKYEFLGVGELGTVYVGANPETDAEGDTKSVHSFDLKTMRLGPVVWSNPKYDVDSIVQDENTGEIIGGCYWVDIYKCEFNSKVLTANLKGLISYFKNERNLFIVSQSDDNKEWVLWVEGPVEPGSYYLYDVERHRIDFLGSRSPKLSDQNLAPMRRLEFKTRDGAGLFAYVTEAAGSTGQPRPLVVLPHGGPTVRDTFSFDSLTQYLATRGYVVIQPNFRGSGGFGRKFAELGYGEWGGRMHQDVMDATRALVAEGKVDPKRICIVGGSYGGYEAMYSAATEPDTFKCAVSFDGVSDLVGIVKFERTFGTDTSTWSYWRKSEGDPATDSAKMLAHSPYRMAANWKTPILLIHGDKDDIVPVEESRQMNRALQAAGKPVRYVEVQGMGHGPSSDEEITKVYSEIAMFLAQYLGEAPAPASPAPAAKPGR